MDVRFSWAKSSCSGWFLMLTLLWKKKEGREKREGGKERQKEQIK